MEKKEKKENTLNVAATVHSYKVLQRPTNATASRHITAAFVFYHAEGCKTERFGPALNSDSKSDAYDNKSVRWHRQNCVPPPSSVAVSLGYTS